MTDDPETPKTSDTIIASAQADTIPGALSDASVTDKPGDGGVLFDADGNPIAPSSDGVSLNAAAHPEGAPLPDDADISPSSVETVDGPELNDDGSLASPPSQSLSSLARHGEIPYTTPSPEFTSALSPIESDVEALKADLLYLRSLHGWPVEEGNKLKAYYHDGLKKLGIGK